MREIKFRAWNGNKMLTQFDAISGVDTFNTCDKKDLLICISGYHWGKSNWGKDCVLMQFTGLLDKNGKEIYEGDYLVRLYGVKWEVKYTDKGYRAFPKSDSGLYFDNADFKDCEVIGNIYEDENLL